MEEGANTRLHDRYTTFVVRAASRGLTGLTGKTPREQRALLEARTDLPVADLDRLVVLLETAAYAENDGASAEGIALCDRLIERLPETLLRPEEEAASHAPRSFRRIGKIVESVLPVLLLCGAIAFVAFVPKTCGGGGGGTSVGRGGGGGGSRRNGSVRGVSSWGSKREVGSVRAADGGWKKTPARPTVVQYQVKESRDPAGEPGATFDADTGTDGDFVGWKDPFSPRLFAHHREFVYTGIDAGYRFYSSAEPLRRPRWPLGRRASYEANILVHLRAGEAVPVPSPSPGVMIFDLRTDPPVEVQFMLDPGDGLRAIASESRRVRMRYRAVGTTDYMSMPLPDVPLADVELTPMHLPESVRADAARVLAVIGEAPPTYAATVRRLHAYFAGFSVAPIRPEERRENTFLTVALARKGVCRHRSRSFFVVANAAGIPTRLVENEIHSFVEVQLPDGRWRGLELRLLDEVDTRASFTTGVWSAEAVTGLFSLVLASVLICGLALLRTRDDDEGHRIFGTAVARAERRAERDRGAGVTNAVVVRLVEQAIARFAERAGCSEDDEGLRAAVEAAGSSMRLRSAVYSLLGLRRKIDADAPLERFLLDEAYWTAKFVLDWAGAE